MPLSTGTRLGPYEIVTAIGAGGMGEVYSAQDRRLGRLVAIKTLSASTAQSPDGRQRFEREAKAISRLSHPHICALYDVGHEGEVEYLVMELLDGETLARRLARGVLPMAQVLRYAREIADALAAAHRQGIVHRDLKPGNVMITASGVKLLDFGLAKSVPASGGDGDASTAALPTSLTEAGAILGTAPYMSPEQIQGQPADARSDIFALGAVLYEMVAGRRAFPGTSSTAVAAEVLHRDPPTLSALQPDVPPAFDRLVRICLVKDPQSRWQTAIDVALQLAGIEEDARQPGLAPAAIAPTRPSRFPRATTLALAAIVVAGAAWLYFGRGRVAPAAPLELQLVPPANGTYYFWVEATTFALSPDGSRLAFVAKDQAGEGRIWIRSLAAIDAKSIAGTERARSVFWSPDGQSIAFFASGVLKRLDFSSGIAVPLCKVNSSLGYQGTWSTSEQILFASAEGEAIHAVSSAGGAVSDIVRPDSSKNERVTKFPWFLPDGRRFLYTLRLRDGTGRLMLGEAGKPWRVLLPVDSNAQSGMGLWAVPLDAPRTPLPLQPSSVGNDELRFSPDGRYYAFTVFESGRPDVYVAALAGGPKYPVSAGGAVLARWNPDGREILYLSTDARVVSVPARWMPTPELGKPETLFTLKGKPWIDFDVSPDGKRLLAVVREIVAEEQPLTAILHWRPEAGK